MYTRNYQNHNRTRYGSETFSDKGEKYLLAFPWQLYPSPGSTPVGH